jgi:hypothetical protein
MSDTEYLTRYAGNFVVIRGSDSIVHFQKEDTSTFRSALELYEVMLYRGMRRIVDGSSSDGIDSIKRTLPLIVAAAIDRLVESADTKQFRLTFSRDFLGSTLEALRLIRSFRRSRPLKVTATFSHRSFLNGFAFLHQDLMRGEEDITIDALSVASVHDKTPLRDGSASLVVANFFKSDSSKLWQTLENQYSSVTQDTSSLFLIARTTIDGEHINVQDVNGNSYKLPDLHAIQTWCEGRFLSVSLLRLHDMDRDFLLPFEGNYDLSLLHITAQPTDILLHHGFHQLSEELQPSSLGSLVPFSKTAILNYDQIFEPDLPVSPENLFSEATKLPWEDDWDPKSISDWHGGHGALDPFIYAHRLSSADRSVAASTRNLVISTLQTSREGELGEYGLIYAAKILKGTDPSLSLACILKVLTKQEPNSKRIGHLLRILMPEFVVPAATPDAGEPGVTCLAISVFKALGMAGWDVKIARLLQAASLIRSDEDSGVNSGVRVIRDTVVYSSVKGLGALLNITPKDLLAVSLVLFQTNSPKLASDTIKMTGVIAPGLADTYSVIARYSPKGTTAWQRYNRINGAIW